MRRLREAGALVAGKTNCDEFAMGSSTEHSAYGPTLNPVDHARVPGGSSGGSAAAVAAGAVSMALGSETGGSVRQPAAFCGVVGIKPTYGRVSRYGLVAFGSSLDQIGTFGRDVASAARLLAAISGRDDRRRHDARPRRRSPPPGPAPASLAGTVIGVPREYFPEGLHAGVARGHATGRSARLRDLGAELRDVSLPHTRYAVPDLLHHRARGGARRTSRATTACGTACAWPTALSDVRALYARHARPAASAPRCGAASCSAPTC